MLMKLFPILRSLSSGCPKGHESASCSPPEWSRTQRLGLDWQRGRSDQWPCILFGHPRKLWIPFCVGFQAASECLIFSRLWTWQDLVLAPWLCWRRTVRKLRKKLGIIPVTTWRVRVCPSLIAWVGSRVCLLRPARTLAGRRLMLSCSARTASRGRSAQLSAQLLLLLAAFCRCDVDTWVARLWLVQSREAAGTDVLCIEVKSWWLFKQAPRSPFHGLRCNALRS